MDDYNINLLQYDTQKDVSNFLDRMYSHSFILYITSPTWITGLSLKIVACELVTAHVKSFMRAQRAQTFFKGHSH